MHFRDRQQSFKFSRPPVASVWVPAVAMFALLIMADATAQTSAPASPSKLQASASSSLSLSANEDWTSLSKSQKVALAPLEQSWASLSSGSRQKWLTIAKTYPDLGPVEQEKLHSRMAEWAALSPKDRELARLNFAQSKAIAKSDRAANWEAYQALSSDERQKLAQGAKVKPVGAAVAVKPVSPEKLTPVPITRHTPEPERAAVVQLRPINRNTLLPQMPQLPGSAPAASAAVAPVKP